MSKKYEYRYVEIPDNPDPRMAEEALNKLGAEGWQVVQLLQGQLHDDTAMGRIWLMREGDQKIDPTG